jgi:hypothetical protein
VTQNQATLTTQCDHCDSQFTVKSKAVGKSATCPKCQGSFLVADPNRTLGRIVLQSGTEHCFDAVFMYDARKISIAEEWRRAAMENLRYQSTGLGFIGGLSTVIVASAILGAVEASATRSANAKGYEMLAHYNAIMQDLRYKGRYRDLSTIDHIQLPNPELWISRESHHGGIVVNVWTMLLDEKFALFRLLDGSPVTINLNCIEQYWVMVPRRRTSEV